MSIIVVTNTNAHMGFVFIAIYIPPKQEQAFNRGGTFIFANDRTVYAHYDESNGAHPKFADVYRLACLELDSVE